MAIVTENLIRKIIKNSIAKKEKANLQEVGFDRLNMRLGRLDAKICDLSNLENTKFALSFAKHFIYNPRVTRTENGNVTQDSVSRNILSFVTGLGLSAEEEIMYEKEVSKALARDPDAIKNWINMLEIAITLTGGPAAASMCKIINTHFLPTSRASSNLDTQETDSKAGFSQAFRESGILFKRAENLQYGRVLFREPETMLLYPKTAKAYFLTPASSNLMDTFEEEDRILLQIIQSNNKKPNQIYEKIEDYVSGSGTRRLRSILKPLRQICLQGDLDNYRAGDSLREHLSDLRNLTYDSIKNNLVES